MASALPKFTLRLTPTTSEPLGPGSLPSALAGGVGGQPLSRAAGFPYIPEHCMALLRRWPCAELVLRWGDLTKYDGCAIVNAANER